MLLDGFAEYIAMVWKACASTGAAAGTLALWLHFYAFVVFLFTLVVSAYLRLPMRYLTIWTLFLHVFYFAHVDLSNSRLDALVGIVHPLSFTAAVAVFVGFCFVSILYGGGMPRDMVPRRISDAEYSAFLAWHHSTPVWIHAVDCRLNAEHFRRIYAGGGLWLVSFGLCCYFVFGQIYEWAIPNTVETYAAPKAFWYPAAHAVARRLRLGTKEDLKQGRLTAFGLREEFLFSWAVKLPGALGGLGAGQLFRRYILLEVS